MLLQWNFNYLPHESSSVVQDDARHIRKRLIQLQEKCFKMALFTMNEGKPRIILLQCSLDKVGWLLIDYVVVTV